MRYTIITPTILRPSLMRMCQSLDKQTCTDWEHIVMVDIPEYSEYKWVLDNIRHVQRHIVICSIAHKNGGNTCRHNAIQYAQGDYIWYVDDDNWIADDDVLESLKVVTGNWALFPILHYGSRFLQLPPGINRTDSGNFIVKRGVGCWPNIPDYNSDGHYIEWLLANYPQYEVFNEIRPLMVMPTSGRGER